MRRASTTKINVDIKGAKKMKEENIFYTQSEDTDRIIHEKEHRIRDNFSRDRDRIMYSKSFRRLSGKTQVFLVGKDDHTRTRLTHSLEVSQIARTIAKALNLNEALVEAIALGHDMGHTPFGHVGERMLDKIMRGCYPIRDFNMIKDIEGEEGFKHNWQGIRVASRLEPPLNLTKQTLWGILNHSSLTYKICDKKIDVNGESLCLFKHECEKKCEQANEKDLTFYSNMVMYLDGEEHNIYNEIKDYWTFEAYIVAIADEIAQRHHDIEDAIEFHLITLQELTDTIGGIIGINNEEDFKKYIEQPQVRNSPEWKEFIEESKENFIQVKDSIDIDNKDTFEGKLSKFLVNHLTSDIIYNMKYLFDNLRTKFELKSRENFVAKRVEIGEKVAKEFRDTTFFSLDMKKRDKKIQEFLSDRILNSQEAQKMDGIGQYILRETFKAYLINPQLLPDKTLIKFYKNYYQLQYKGWWQEALIGKGLMDEKTKKIKVGEIRSDINKEHYKARTPNYKNALLRTICDYIAGMTDKYIMDKHREFYNITY